MHLEGDLRLMSWDEKAYDAAEGQPKFTHARVTHELTGAIQGEASVCYLMAYRPDESATFVGFATITGSVDGQDGSFVLQDVGAFENGVARGRWTVLQGMGRGAFADIRGDGHFAAGEGGASYRLDVSF